MIAPPRWPSAVLTSLLSALAAAQQADGRVFGFDGRPVGDAIVVVRTGKDGREVLTDADGRFSVPVLQPVTSAQAQLEGVVLEIPLRNGTASGLELDFAVVPHFTVRGRLLLPDGTAAAGRDILCRGEDNKALASVTTDERGAWSIRLGQPVELEVDPTGWQHVVAGRIDRDRQVTIELGRGDPSWFAVRGRVLDEGGPCADELLRASLGKNRFVRVRSGPDGGYVLWSNHPIEEIDVLLPLPMRRPGPFAEAATAVDIEAREHAFRLVIGRFVSADGAPLAGAAVHGVERDGPPPRGATPHGKTDADGRFCLRLPRSLPFVHAALSDATGTGAVPATRTTLEIRAAR